jgi:hypothetical protein
MPNTDSVQQHTAPAKCSKHISGETLTEGESTIRSSVRGISHKKGKRNTARSDTSYGLLCRRKKGIASLIGKTREYSMWARALSHLAATSEVRSAKMDCTLPTRHGITHKIGGPQHMPTLALLRPQEGRWAAS